LKKHFKLENSRKSIEKLILKENFQDGFFFVCGFIKKPEKVFETNF